VRITSKKQGKLGDHGQLIMLGLGSLVGVLGGLGAVGFRLLINYIRTLAYGSAGNFLEVLDSHAWWYRILIPIIGGAIVGPMIYFLAREAKGHGVPEVMEAVALKNGFIRKRVVAIKSLASAISIAAGGSVGREGPIVQIASAIGSSVGQILKVSPSRMRILVGCGTAAGIAATFNAPLAGVMFALEVILGEFAIATFSPIILSAVIATAVSRHFLGDELAFIVPAYHIVSYWELGLYSLLGIAAGLVAASFTTLLYKVEDLFDAWPFPDYLKTPIMGAGLGILGLAFPAILGVGYEGMELALHGQMAWWLLFVIMGIKILATSATIGGGMSGGIFAPSLFIGAMLGGGFGYIVHSALPDITAGAGAYALVAMAAVVSGTTHGPLAAFLIMFEMTNTYTIILPLMISCAIATIVARQVRVESIYTLKLLRRGLDIRSGKEMNLLRSLKVSQAMQSKVVSVPMDMTLHDFYDFVVGSKKASFPVVNPENQLVGIVGHSDYADYFQNKDLWQVVVVMELATKDVVTVSPDDSLDSALQKLAIRDYATLPVVSRNDGNKLVGVVSHRDITSYYNRSLRKVGM
jgi:CIC family chloride channel protein